MMNAESLILEAAKFNEQLAKAKATFDPQFPWYPYDTLGNFIHLKPILDGFPLDTLAGPEKRILDIGAADGDLALFLEQMGYEADIIDHSLTNFNGLRGARLLCNYFKSRININDVDLDSQFSLPDAEYDLIFFLGILYHLKNPFYVMESLSKRTTHMLVSTRVARLSPHGTPIRDIPVAYLLGPAESNNDSTNYWIFSESGLMRLFERTGWDLIVHRSVGDVSTSDPARMDRDERAFALLKSRTHSLARR
jgi:tRNA (mo5U34)-methyltransferase